MHIRDVQNKKFKNLGIENCHPTGDPPTCRGRNCPPTGDLPKGEKLSPCGGSPEGRKI